MNGAGTRNGYGSESGSGPLSPTQGGTPRSKAILEAYRKDIMSGFEKEKPRYNPLNLGRPQSSPLVDLKDPIQVHLLTEIALADSREWEILSQEEVDELKKQCQSLNQRIEQTRAELAMQSNYLKAAASMTKLYSPIPKRRSLLGNRNSGGDAAAAREAELEKQASERRCEELATELIMLEKRLMEPQRRLDRHTAGILQLTHKASKKPVPAPPPNGQPANGIPGSPESLYTYANSRDSMELPAGDAFFDDRSLYLTLDQVDGQIGSRSRKNTIEIPTKSPVRKETQELREESDRLRDENRRLYGERAELKAANDSMSLELDALRRDDEGRLQTISNTERRIVNLNSQLREVIVRFNPEKNGSYKRPPSGRLEPGELLGSQLQYLNDGLAVVREEQDLTVSTGARESESAAGSLAEAESRMEALNRQIWSILQTGNQDLPPPPEASGSGVDGQLDWLQDSIGAIDSEIARVEDASGAALADRQKVEQVDAILRGLWDIFQSGLAEIQRKKDERRQARQQMGLAEDPDDMSGDESPISASEPYSLQAFSTKVQWLYAQATNLREQKSVLKRQIKQQRELNSKSDSEKEQELQKKSDELQQLQEDARDVQDQLARALLDLEAAQKVSAANEANDAAAVKATQEQLRERDARIASMDSSNKELQAKLGEVEAEIASLAAQLQQATEAKAAAEAEAERAAEQARGKDEELEQLNLMVIELKTEATIAKAELDGAYGSRAQRAADVAALAKSSENAELHTQVDKLKDELASTLREFEDLTRDTLAAEREKLDLEGRLDDALAARASLEAESRALRDKLEAEVAALKEELDAEKLKVGAGGAGTARGGAASMLSEQFRATMKEERKRFQEELRAEQMQRRKLEDEVRVLRRAAGPGKSSLSLSPR